MRSVPESRRCLPGLQQGLKSVQPLCLCAFQCMVEVLHCKLLTVRALSAYSLPSPEHGALKQIRTGITFISA